MGKFDFMNGKDISLDAKREFVTVRDLIDSLGEKFNIKSPIYLEISKGMSFKLSRPRLLDMDSSVKISADSQTTSDLNIGTMIQDCDPKGCLDLPIRIIYRKTERLVKSFKIGTGASGLKWIDLMIS